MNTPSRSYSEAAGWDFYVPNSFDILPGMVEDDLSKLYPRWESKTIYPGTSVLIPSGLQLKIPKGYALKFDNKSGVASKGLLVGATIVDSDYQGEVHLNVWNVSKAEVTVYTGQKLLQGVFFQVQQFEIDEVTSSNLFDKASDRGRNGFGSTDTRHGHKQ